MTARRVLPIVLLLLLALPAAAAASAKPIKVKPKFYITPVPASGKSVKPRVTTTFPVPTGADAAKICTGKITVKVPIGKKRKKKVFAVSKTSLRNEIAFCRATAAPKLPLKLINTKLTFHVSFDGNKNVSGFDQDRRFQVDHVDPPTSPSFGTSLPESDFWAGYLPGFAPPSLPSISFFMSPGPTLYGVGEYTPGGPGLPFTCTGGGNITNGGNQTLFSATTPGSPFSFAAPPVTLTNIPSEGSLLHTDMRFEFSSAVTGTLTLHSTGSARNFADGTLHTGCDSGTITLTLRGHTGDY
jgi:hypothetical protein